MYTLTLWVKNLWGNWFTPLYIQSRHNVLENDIEKVTQELFNEYKRDYIKMRVEISESI